VQNEIKPINSTYQLSQASMESFSKICGGQYGARPRVRQRKMTALQGNWSSNSFMTEVYPPEEKRVEQEWGD